MLKWKGEWMTDKVRVFVSHHHSLEEDAFTARLVGDLEAADADVWVDDRSITSNNFVQKISEGLDSRQWLVLVMTPYSVASPWVRNEVNTALNEQAAGRMLGVIPIVMVEVSEHAIPVLWRPLHRYDAISNYERARDGLLRALGLNGSTVSGSPTTSTQPSQDPIASTDVEPLDTVNTDTLVDTQEHELIVYAINRLPKMPERLAGLGFESVYAVGVSAFVPPVITINLGHFLMGSDKSHDKDALEDELPLHRVVLAAFQISKYPVTVAEYALAVTAGAVSEPGPRDSERNFFKIFSCPGITWEQQMRKPDYPVVHISWQDAISYANWLANQTNQPWRLPTEAEWEKAARWDMRRGVSRVYPWGNAFGKDRCNTNESQNRGTTPIGSYRSGASPWGIEDVAGNVQEWTSSRYRRYPYVALDGREDLESKGVHVLRGGSWYLSAQQARSARRGSHTHGEVAATGDCGFRLALSVPSVYSILDSL